jgi:hypothetical protein
MRSLLAVFVAAATVKADWLINPPSTAATVTPPPTPHRFSRCTVEPQFDDQNCSTPDWEATYLMNRSTIIMPCDYDQYFSNTTGWATIRRFGLVDIDWSNNKQKWVNTQPMMTCEEDMVEQAKIVKSVSKDKKVQP